MISCYLECKLPSVNSLYWHRGSMKIMKTPAKQLRDVIVANVVGDCLANSKLKAVVEVGGDWYYKNGNMRKRDIVNLDKFLMDSIFKDKESDDKQLWVIVWRKIQDTKDWFSVKIEEIK